jgi:sulfur carrier protein ThiS adenylyltransferase
MTFDEISRRLGKFTVGIAGCGGLGSNCAAALARSGVGHLIIADFDVVSFSNLNRQYYFVNQVGEKKSKALKTNINMINPSTTVTDYDLKLNPENCLNIFKDCDVVVEAFDMAEEKQMLLETLTGAYPSMPIVTGIGMAGYGNSHTIHYRSWGNIHICGDETSEIGPDSPPMAPRVGMVASMQANVVVELLLKKPLSLYPAHDKR